MSVLDGIDSAYAVGTCMNTNTCEKKTYLDKTKLIYMNKLLIISCLTICNNSCLFDVMFLKEFQHLTF